MRDVFLRGSGLACALGEDLDACTAALRSRESKTVRVDVEAFAEPISVNYFRIADGAELFDPRRLERLLPPIAAAAAAGLSAPQRRRMSIFVGSSCFSITQSETEHALAMDRNPDTALALPRVGFQTIGDIVRKASGSEADDFTWNTACTSSANALLAARRMLAQGQIEHALVVGVELANLTSISGFSALQLLADKVRPFDARRSGIVLGEAVGAVVLSNAAAADDDFRLRGGAANCDTYSVTTANPDGRVLAAVQRRALEVAGARPDDVRAIKAHATGTPANDAGEAHGMRQVYETLPPVTALKPFIGHTLGACGVVELAMLAGALRDGFIPASTGFETVDPDLNIRPLDHAPRAESGVYQLNQFGFGGNNVALVLEAG